MADRYWVGGTGTWDTTTTTNWSETTGGTGGASVPTSADSVFFDQAATYTVTMTGALNCLDITMSAGTPTTTGSATLDIYGSLSTIGSAVIWQNSGTITFAATTTGKTINTNSSWIQGSVVFNGIGGGWSLLSSYNMRNTAGGVSNFSTTLTNGALDLAGFSWDTNSFLSNNANTRSIAFGSGNINAQPSSSAGTTVLNLTDLTGFTYTGTGAFRTDTVSTITINAPTTGVTIDNAPNLIFLGVGTAAITMSASSTWGNLDFGSIGSSPTFTTNVAKTVTLTTGTGSLVGVIIYMIGTGNFVNTAAKAITALLISTSGTVTLSNNVITNGLTVTGEGSGTFNVNNFTVTATAGNGQIGTVAVNQTGSLIMGTGTISCVNFVVNGTLNLTSGTIIASTAFYVGQTGTGGSFTYTAGTITTPLFYHQKGTVILAANATLPTTATGTYQFATGTITLNGFNLTTGIFSGYLGGAKVFEFGSNYIILAHPTAGTTVLTGTSSGMSFTGTGGFAANMSVTRTFNLPNVNGCPNLFINGGASVPTFSGGTGYSLLDFTGSTCTPAGSAVNVGSLILASGGTYTGLSIQCRTFDAGPGTITTNGKPIAAFSIISSLNTVTLAGALSCTTFSQQSGTLDFATFNLTCSGAASYTAGTFINTGTLSCATFTNNGTFTFDNGTITPSTSFVNAVGSSFTYNSPAVLSPVPTFTQTAGTVTLNQNLLLAATGTYTLTAGTLTLNNNTLTTGIFSSSSVSTRNIAFGTGFISLAHTGAGQTVLSMGALTGYSWTGTGGFTSIMSVARTFTIGTVVSGSSTTATNLFITGGASIPTLTNSGGFPSWFNTLDFTGSTCTPAATLFNVSTLVLSTDGVYNTVGFAPQFTRTQTWTPQFSKGLGGFGVNGVGITVTLGGSQFLNTGSTTTLTNGTLDLGGFDFEARIFSSSNSNTRAIVFGTNNIILNTMTSAVTVLNMANATGFTYTGTGGFVSDGASAFSYDVPRTLVFGTTGGTAVNAPNLSVTGGTTNIVTLTAQSWFNTVTFTGSAVPVAGIINVSTLTLATGGTYTSLEPQFTRTQTWTPQFSKQLGGFGVNGSGITVTMGAAQSLIATATTTLTNGTLDLGGFDFTTGIFASTNTNTRSIAFGTNNIILAHTTLGTVVLSCAIATGFTYTGTGGFTSAMSVTRTFTFGTTGGTATNSPSLSLPSGASIPSFTTNSWFKTLDFTGSTCTPSGIVTVNVSNLTLASGGTYTSLSPTMVGAGTITTNLKTVSTLTINHTGTTTLTAGLTCTACTITSGTFNFATFNLACTNTFQFQGALSALSNIGVISCSDFNISTGGTLTLTSGTITPSVSLVVGNGGTFNYNGGTLSATAQISHSGTGVISFGKAYALAATGTYSFTGGSLTLNGFDLTTGIFASSGSTARSIAFGTGNIILAHTTVAQTVLSCATATAFTWTGTGGFTAAANITRTYTFGTTNGSTTNAPNLTLTGSGTAVQTFTTNSWFNKLDFGTTAFNPGTTTLNLNGFTLSSGGTFSTVTATMRGTGTITSSGNATLGALTINSTSGTTSLSAALTLVATGTTTLTTGALELNGFNLTTGIFASTGTATRSIAFGTGNIILAHTTLGTVVLNFVAAAGYTYTGTGGFVSDASITRTFTFGTNGGTAVNAPNLAITSGAAVITITTNSWFNTLDFTGTTSTPATATVNVSTLTLATGGTYTNLSPAFTRTQTWTPQFSKQLGGFGVNTEGITVTMGAVQSLVATATTTLTAGTLDLGGFDFTTGIFAFPVGANLVRAIAFGTNNIILSHTTAATTVLSCSSAIAFTWTGTGGFVSDASITRTFVFGNSGGNATNAVNLSITSGAAVITITTNSWFNILDFTGTTSTPATAIVNVSTLTLATGGTYTSLSPVLTSTQTWTPQFSKQLGGFGVNGSGITVTMGAAQSLVATATTTLTNGTLDLGGFDFTTGIFSSTNTNTRSIAFGSNNIIVSHTTAATTVLDCTIATGLTWTGTGGFVSDASITRTYVFGTTGGTAVNAPNLAITSGAAVITITTNSWFNNLDFTGTTSTPATAIVNVSTLTLATGGTYTSLSPAFTRTQTWTPQFSKQLGGFGVNTAGITVTMGAAQSLIATATTTLTNGTLDLGGFDFTTGIFSSTNTNTRSIAFGTNNIILSHTTAAQAVLSMATATGFTYTGTGGFTSDASITRTYTFGTTGGTATISPNLTLTGSGTAVQTFTTNSWFNKLDFGNTAFFIGSTAVNVNSFTLSDAVGSGFSNFQPTMRSTGTIISKGETINLLTINAPGSTVTMTDALTLFNGLTSTAGTLDLGVYNLTATDFTSTGPFPRSITGTSSTVTITSNTSAAWSFGSTGSAFFNTTNQRLTLAASSVLNLSGGTWTTEFWMYPTVTPTVGNQCRIFMSGTNATTTAFAIAYNNDGSISAAVPNTGATGVSSAAGVITLNVWNHVAVVSTAGTAQIFINGTPSGSAVAITQPVSSSPTLFIGYDVTAGASFQYQGYITNARIVNTVAVYTGAFTPSTAPLLPTQSSGTNISAITGTQTSLLLSTPVNSITTDFSTNALAVTNVGTVTANALSPFTATSPGITFTGFTINMTGSSPSFGGGGATYPILNRAGPGNAPNTLIITGSSTFSDIQTTIRPTTIRFTAGTTTTVSEFTLTGTAGNLVTINSVTAGTQFTLSKISGAVNASYLSIKDSNATGGASWDPGQGSVNVSNNTGWLFSSYNGAGNSFVFF